MNIAETNPKAIFRKIAEDKKHINDHLAKGKKLEELHEIKFSKPRQQQNI